MEKQTFHESVGIVIFLSQIFGMFPVSNVLYKNHLKLKYSWLSVPVFYATIIMMLNLTEFGIFLVYLFKSGINFGSSGTISLYVICLLEHVYFWRLASKWPSLMQLWRQVEDIFLKTPYNLYATFNMKFKIHFWYFVIMIGGLVEHTILMSNAIQKSELERTQCKLNISIWECLYKRDRIYLQNVIPFSYWILPILERTIKDLGDANERILLSFRKMIKLLRNNKSFQLKWINLTLAYARSFTDTFIIVVSIGFATRFRQLYLRIDAVKGKSMPSIFWMETREHYLVLKKLLRIINDDISVLILLASANNMYFICFQLFNSFSNIGVDWIAEFGFWFSLIFNIIRTILTLYLAATVNDYTKKIISCLRDIPSKSWCMETQRFSEQLSVDLTAFTGSGFFFMTRKLILAMASTIVTYELLVTDVINQGSIKQITDYCSHYYEATVEGIVENS